jgi:hypothetical protein
MRSPTGNAIRVGRHDIQGAECAPLRGMRFGLTKNRLILVEESIGTGILVLIDESLNAAAVGQDHPIDPASLIRVGDDMDQGLPGIGQDQHPAIVVAIPNLNAVDQL